MVRRTGAEKPRSSDGVGGVGTSRKLEDLFAPRHLEQPVAKLRRRRRA